MIWLTNFYRFTYGCERLTAEHEVLEDGRVLHDFHFETFNARQQIKQTDY